MIKVALVDDHTIVRSGFAQLLSFEADIEVVGEFGSALDARKGLADSKATVCIVDISMPDESGLSLLLDIPKEIKCIMLSVHDSIAIIEKALETGAQGYLSKRCSPDELIQAVKTVNAGGCYLTPDIAMKIASPNRGSRPIGQLTKRELQISEMLATGLNVKTVAANLGLSPKTVHVHRSNAMDKLNVKNNVELAKFFNNEAI